MGVHDTLAKQSFILDMVNEAISTMHYYVTIYKGLCKYICINKIKTIEKSVFLSVKLTYKLSFITKLSTCIRQVAIERY